MPFSFPPNQLKVMDKNLSQWTKSTMRGGGVDNFKTNIFT